MERSSIKRQERQLRRWANKLGYRLREDQEGGWSFVAVSTGQDSSLGTMNLDQVAEALFSMG